MCEASNSYLDVLRQHLSPALCWFQIKQTCFGSCEFESLKSHDSCESDTSEYGHVNDNSTTLEDAKKKEKK